MKLTKQDYRNALEIYNVSSGLKNIEISFPKYIKEKLEQPETPLYRCIQLPPANNGSIKIGNLYSENHCIVGFSLSDLPNHFELVEPEPEPEKITWQEVVTLINNAVISNHLPPDSVFSDLIKILERIKTDHL